MIPPSQNELSPRSPCVTILPLLLLLEFAHFPRVQNLDLGLPFLHISPQEVVGVDLYFLLILSVGIVTKRDEVPG